MGNAWWNRVGSSGRLQTGQLAALAYTRFVIISHLRSGTHLLRTLLESHPALVCQSEVFNSDDPQLPYPLSTPTQEILDGWVYRDFGPEVSAAGFVVQIYHPFGLAAFPGIRHNPAWGDIWSILQAMPDLHVIHLLRENGLRRHLSHVLARKTGQWHDWDEDRLGQVTHLHAPKASHSPAGPRPAVALDRDRLEADFREVEALHAAVTRRFSGSRYFQLSYEQMCADPETIGADLLAFIGLPPCPLSPAVSKLESRPLAQSISNYPELHAAFQETRWAHFFED